MTIHTGYDEGMLCWADLSTTDLPAAKKFYGHLFGWTMADAPTGDPDTVYVMCKQRGHDAAALQAMPDALKAQGIPPHWLAYVSVKDVDARAKKVEAHGGQLLMSPMDVMEAGRMALVADPTGATFALWQGKKHPGAGVMSEPGSLSWMELMTKDPKAATAFYSAVLPWTAKVSPEYTEWQVGKQAAGGMMEMKGAHFEGVPSHWTVYFTVEDCDAAVKKAHGLGASVLLPPTDVAEVGRFAVLQDPQGAAFNLIKLAPHG